MTKKIEKKDCLCCSRLTFNSFSKNFKVGICQNCGLERFVNKRKIFFDYNNQNEKYTDENYLNGSVIRWSHKKIPKIVNVVGRKILEVGCFTGFYLNYLEKFGSIVEGIDINLKAIAHGKLIYPKSIKLQSSFTNNILIKEYDIILSIDFLEHIEDPNSMIKLLKRKLKKGGFLVIAGPLDKRFFHDKSDYPPHHLWRFTFKGIDTLCNKHGFVFVGREDEYNMALFLRNLLGKLLHGINKKEFYGAAHTNFSKHYLSIFAEEIYRTFEFFGRIVFFLLRIRYGSSILIYRKK